MVDSAMEDRPHEIDGRELKPKRAVPKEEANDPQAHAEVSTSPFLRGWESAVLLDTDS